ncbi:MAG: hypothetical protein FIB08_02970 [Candidatus Methanoperedens sp.]|nr:hypothetical protein [Candidatus Methanoperedens sp.]
MTKMGEVTDKILEYLNESENLTLKEVKKRVPAANKDILDFMEISGLIEQKKGAASITKLGIELLKVEH